MSYIYVIEFEGGLIKVGRTTKPDQRIACHKGNVYSISRAQIKNQWVSIKHTNARENENKLISFCCLNSNLTTKRTEWFNDVNFSDAVEYAEGLIYSQTPTVKSSPEFIDSELDRIFGSAGERRRVGIAYQCAISLQSFILDSLWIGGDVFKSDDDIGFSPFVVVVGAYFASGNPTDMLIEELAEISIDAEKELEAVYEVFNRALEYVKNN